MKHYIRKGHYYSFPPDLGIHFGKTNQKFKVKFSKSCLYTPIDWENDYNKLVGWSYGLHHNNSIRVCWRPQWDKQKIQLCIYVYQNGKLKIVETALDRPMLLDVEKEYELEITHFPNNGIIMLSNLGHEFGSNSVLSLYSTLDTKPKWGYLLWPYFGGNNPAPQNMDIELIRL